MYNVCDNRTMVPSDAVTRSRKDTWWKFAILRLHKSGIKIIKSEATVKKTLDVFVIPKFAK
jgi:hypothetical protein